jgi:DNA-binding SARP family transcriptional activator
VWKLQVLGPVRVTMANTTEISRLGAKSEAVLAYLAVHGADPCSRLALIELLWADCSVDDARNAFRQWLFHFRRTFGEPCPLRAEGDLLWIDRAVCHVDLWRFLELARSEESADWQQACALFTGELADQLAGTPEFEHWVAAQRELVRSVARGLLVRMSERTREAATTAAASALARLLIANDPIDEVAYRALMILQQAHGQRAKALETWRECRRALMSEVGAQPSTETFAVYQRMHGTGKATVKPYQFPLLRLVPGAGATPRVPVSDDAIQAATDIILRGIDAFLLGSAEDNVRARMAFHAAARLVPHATQPGALEAMCHFRDFNRGWNGSPQANYRKAAALAVTLRKRFPDDPLPHATCGHLLLWGGHYQRAIEEIEIALKGFDSPWLLAFLADAHMRAGNPKAALALIGRAFDMEPNEHGEFRTIEGMAWFAMGDLDAALDAFGSATRRHPRCWAAQGGLAAVYAELGDIEAARAATAVATMGNLRLSIDFARRGAPFADQEVRDRWANAWLAAGMPQAERRWPESRPSPLSVESDSALVPLAVD